MLHVAGIYKNYSGKAVLADVSFEMDKGEILALLGPSGSGKSTLLNIIAGLEAADEGRIEWDGQDMVAIPVHERDFGFMFQDYALFPHRDVQRNVAFGLEMRADKMPDIQARVAEVLALVGLEGFEKRDVAQLSGGEQQRVALARALAPKPKLLMLDEPLGSLDRALREELGEKLGAILQESQQSSIYVTHDQEEAFSIADRVVLLNQGRIEQIGRPQELYFAPRTRFVANFIGLKNIFPATISQKGKRSIAHTALGDFELSAASVKGEASLLIRPDCIRLDAKGPFTLKGILRRKAFKGRYSELDIDINGQRLAVQLIGDAARMTIGEDVRLSFDPSECVQVLADG